MDAYKKEITWTRGDGEQVKAVVETTVFDADGKKTVWVDGDRVEVDAIPTAQIHATVYSRGISLHYKGNEGEYVRMAEPQRLGSLTLVAKAGRLGITADHAAEIEAAITEAKAVAAAATARKYDDNPNNLHPLCEDDFSPRPDRLAGRGVCPHCGGYCDGDCTANA